MAAERAAKEVLLNKLWSFYHRGLIDLYFGDESAFSMNPKLPYGWAPRSERIKIFPMKDKKINLLKDKKINLFGVFRADNFAVTSESQENIASDFLIRSIHDFCQYIEKPTVLVL